MSRFSGPQGSGAARGLATARRVEAETRQATEAAREKARIERLDEQEAIRALTAEELDELLAAAAGLGLARELTRLGVYRPRTTGHE